MKHINYSFSNSDIKTILFTLSIFPSLESESTETQANINYQGSCSATQKIITGHISDLTPNEFRVIFASLLGAQLINQGKLSTDSETKKECAGYLFSINKLVSTLDELL